MSRAPARPAQPGRAGQRIGDRRVRVERRIPVVLSIRPRRAVRKPRSPWSLLTIGFLVLIAIGTALLSLPFASADGRSTDLLTALFTATSAACVTGLIVVDTATHWSPFGHVVILGLVQVGGFGFMTGSTVLLFLLVGRRTALRDRLLVQAYTGVAQLGGATDLLKRIAIFTIGCELGGAAILWAAFTWTGHPPHEAAWWGLFHSVSAFNNAGFDLVGQFRSLTPYASVPAVLVPIGLLVVLGSLGFAIVGDVGAKRSWRRLALETKIVLATSVMLLVGGAILIGAAEWDNPSTLGALEPADRALNAAFHSAIARSGGFNAVPMDTLTDSTLLILIALMFIGGASGSTGGGIKVNTFSVLLVAILSTARGDPSATAFGRRIPHVIVYRAVAVALLSVAVVFGTTLGLEILAGGDILDQAFESVSALGTVGLSTGVTPALGDPARLLVAAAMFAGRLGPLTLVLALAARERPVSVRPAVETMRIG